MFYEFIQNLTPQKIKRYVVTAVLLIGSVSLLIWLYSHSFISVSTEGASGKVTYQLTRDNSKPTEFSSSSSTVKRLVKRGNYRVITKSGTSSHVAVVKVSGFLGTKNIEAKLTAERSRTFVGKNPQTCMVYDRLLFSYQCGNSVTSLISHVPATDSQPTYINKTIGASASWQIRGTVSGPGENVYVLVLSAAESEDGSQYYLYEINPAMKVVNRTVLSDLNATDQTYKMQRYKNGFIAYNDPFNKAYYYTSPGSPAKAIEMNIQPPESKEQPYAVNFNGDLIVVAYPTTAEKKDKKNKTNASEAPVGDATNVFVGKDGDFKILNFKGNYSNISACGTQKMCLFGNGDISVYDISGKNPKFLYEFTGVTDMQSLDKNILFNSGGNLIDFDVDKATGYISYSLGDYKYCGFAATGNGYLLCVVSNKGEKNALLINRDAELKDEVDKKLNTLTQLIYITGTSVYGNYVYISPNLGKLIYNPTTKVFGYDQTTKEAAKKAIDEAVDKLGIDRQRYKITIYQVD